MIRAVFLFASIFFFGCTIPTLAAACTAPPGAEGDITYNTTHKMMQFCNGTQWVAMAGPSSDGGGSGGAEACVIGDAIGSGYCAGSISGKDLIALPRGCAISAATIANCTGSDRSSSYQGSNEANGTYEIEAFVDGDLAQAFALATDNGDNTQNIAKYCASITIDGESWRAPTAPEMLMLYDSSPSLPAAARLNSLTAGYWSANQQDNGNNAFYVDGDNWARLGTANSQGTTQRIRCVRTATPAAGGGGGPTASDGYFVYTEPVDPDFGGLAGANSYCLSELTSRDWKNKDIALANGQLIASKVRAFLCDGSTCQNAEPDTTYYFASSHDSSAGGASFTTDSSGRGPNDNELWRTADRFSGGAHNAQAYWSGRAQGTNTSLWPNTSSTDHCSGWTTTSSGVDGRIGFVNDYYTNQARWSSWTAQCSGSLSLVCFVHP